ncbi:MAG: phenylacetate--CoA ligase family protein [Desulfobulbaceae bacterium]|nr:phenylacetate--CoA ligase family protein [Desulfobulbaceae bacterium]
MKHTPLPLSSAVSGITWPALPNANASGLVALTMQLETSQWWPSKKLHRQQQHQLSALLDHAAQHVPFFRKTLAKTDLTRLTPQAWQKIPLLTRALIQKSGQSLFSTSTPKEHGQIGQLQTSGSTGKPIVTLQTSLTQYFLQALTLREHFWHHRDFSAKMVAIRPEGKLPPGQSMERLGWGPATDGLIKPAPFAAMNARTTVDQQAKWLVQQNPVYFLSLPSNINALARYFLAKNWRLPALKEVKTYGELLDDSVRALCQEAWNVPVVDTYSAQEVGTIALQCPEAGNYHVMAESIMVEIIDENGKPCPPHEVGRVVLTPLHNFAMPLIRYEIGDYAAFGAPCSCGRGLPVLEKIAGRQRNMLILPDGRQHWPSFPAEIWLPFPAIRQFQLIQRQPYTITVCLVAETKLTPLEENHLTASLQERFTYPFVIDFEYLSTIERSKGGKFEDFISEITAH